MLKTRPFFSLNLSPLLVILPTVLSLASCLSTSHSRQNVTTQQSDLTGFDAVVAITDCTGTMVEPNVVLTSAHCVYDKTSQTLKIGEASFESKKIVIHPKYEQTDINRTPFDLALIWFEGVNSQYTLPICEQRAFPKDLVSIVGFGVVCQNLGSNACRYDGLKRQGYNVVHSVALNGAILTHSKRNMLNLRKALPLGYKRKRAHIGPGDSGGPIVRNGCLLGTVKGAVNSEGFSDNHTLYSGYSNAVFYRDWITSELEKAKLPGTKVRLPSKP